MPYINSYFYTRACYSSGAIDATTLSYISINFGIGLKSLNNGQSVRFNDTGSRVSFAKFDTREIHEYILTVPWTISSAVYYGFTAAPASELSTRLTGFCFSDDGSKMYCVGFSPSIGQAVRYDLGTPYDTTTAVFATGQELDLSLINSNGNADVADIHVSNDGTTMVILYAGTNARVFTCNLSTPYDLTTAALDYNFLLDDELSASSSSDIRDMHITPDGRQIFLIADTDHVVFQFDLVVGYDLDTMMLTSITDISAVSTTPRGFAIGNSNSSAYILDNGTDFIYQYSISGPTECLPNWELDISGTTYDDKFFTYAEGPDPQGVFFKDDGTKMYISDFTNRFVYQYTLSTAWDVSTASYDSVSLSLTTQIVNAVGLFIGNSGASLYVGDNGDDDLHQYTMTTPWDLSTASYSGNSFSTNQISQTDHRAVWFAPDGQRMYTLNTATQIILTHWLKTAWDITTAVYMGDNLWFDFGAEDTSPRAIVFNQIGSQCFVTGTTGDTIIKYDTISYYRPDNFADPVEFSISTQSNDPRGLFIKPDDGSKMYLVDVVDLKVYQYSTVNA